jgi:hypothetical protein
LFELDLLLYGCEELDRVVLLEERLEKCAQSCKE